HGDDPQCPSDLLYYRLKEESPGAALLFAIVLQKRDLLPPGLAIDLQTRRNPNIPLWLSGVCHLMTPSVLEKCTAPLKPATSCSEHMRFILGNTMGVGGSIRTRK